MGVTKHEEEAAPVFAQYEWSSWALSALAKQTTECIDGLVPWLARLRNELLRALRRSDDPMPCSLNSGAAA